MIFDPSKPPLTDSDGLLKSIPVEAGPEIWKRATRVISSGLCDLQVNGFAGVEILAKKLDSLERTIANKPEHTIQVEQIIGGAMAITRNTKKGNTNIYNRYRVS